MAATPGSVTGVGMPDPATVDRPWTDAYPPGVPPTYPIPRVGLPRLLADAVRDFPTGEAIAFAGRRWDWAEVGRLVERTAVVLAGQGVGAGDRVGLVLPNVPAMVVCCLATWRLGASVVPVEPREATAELERVLGAAGCRVVVAQSSDLDRVAGVRDAVEGLEVVVGSAVHAWLPRTKRVLFPIRARRSGAYRRIPSDAGFVDLEAAVEAATGRAPTVAIDPDAEAAVLFTGGTTGRRKGVVLSHHNLVANAFQARLWVPDVRAGHERVLCVVPFAHAYGLTLGMLVATLVAGTMVLPHDPDPAALPALVAAERPTLLPAVPAVYRAMVERPEAAKADLTSLRACVSGAAPLPPELVAAFEARSGGARLREGYGLSEAGPLTHATPIYGRRMDGAIGLPVTGTVAIVVDPADPTRRLGPGRVGELAVHGPQVMQGYLDDPEATAEVLRDGWLLTGDLVRCDAAGVFTLVGRRRDVISTRGMHVYPLEVEDVLRLHPDVADAAVVGRPREDGDELVVAHVVARPGRTVDPEELALHCRHRLAPYAVPAVFDLRSELPRNDLGKVLRRELREEPAGREEPTGREEPAR